MTARRGAAVLLLTAALAASAPAPAQPPGRSWRDGPVRYLLSEDEYRQYGRVRSAEARATWVERFWRRLDADPTTPGNEFRQRFEARVAETAPFREPLTPGWRTDRGRVLLMAGPPTSVRRDSRDAMASEREVWTFATDAASGRSGVEVVFYRDGQGRFRLDPEPYVPPRLVQDEEEVALMARAMRRVGASEASVRRLMRSILYPSNRANLWPQDTRHGDTALHAPPPPVSAAKSSILETGTWFFQARDGSALALLAVEAPAAAVAESAEAAVWIWDALEGSAGESLRVPLTQAEESGAAEGRRRWTGRAYVEAGTYELRFAVGESPPGTLLVHGERVEVPELGLGALAASSVVPAERFGPASGKGSVFAVGSEEVVPRPGATFHRSEPLRLYFQLYGATPDARTRRPRVDLRVSFSRLGRRSRRQGDPFVVRGASGASMGLSLPVGNWPVGEYRAQIDLHDRVSGRRATTEGRFRIRE